MVNNPGPAAISSPSHDRRGMWLVVGLVGLGLALAAVGVWFQWGQTRRCLAFYGATQAERISTAPRVELWTLQGGRTGNVAAVERFDISQAGGLVHLRRGLVEDANFNWDGLSGPIPADAWDVAFVFFAPAGVIAESTTLAIDFGAAGGSLTVVGQPGRVGVGRIGAGLKKWVNEATEKGRTGRGL